MGTIFLSGGGDKKNTNKFNASFMARICSEKPLLFIPVAMDGMVPYRECEEWVKSVFRPLGITRIEMWTELHNRNLEELRAFSALYIGGGNTFMLLKSVRDSGFSELLKTYIKEGGTVIGSSAGAIILGENIGTCAHLDVNGIGLKELNGMSLVHGFSVWVHYTPENDVLIERYVLSTGIPVLAIPEMAGVTFEDRTFMVTGIVPAFHFHQKGESVERHRMEPGAAPFFLKENCFGKAPNFLT
jgi:dipeptidase E